MSLLTTEKDILNFIKSKKNKIQKLDYNTIINYFCKIIIKTMTQTYQALYRIEYSLICTDIVFNIFWILMNYTFNIKLTMFLCDRAIILFNEYVEMVSTALSYKFIKEKKIKLNILDIKIFIYNKTLGPILLESKKLTKRKANIFNELMLVKRISISIKELLFCIFNKINSSSFNKELEDDKFEYSYTNSIKEEIIQFSIRNIIKINNILKQPKYITNYEIFIETVIKDINKNNKIALYINKIKQYLENTNLKYDLITSKDIYTA